MTEPNKLAVEIEKVVLGRVASGRLVIPAMPLAATKCMEILRDPDFKVQRLVQEIETDPVLALLIVRSANTAAMSRGRPTTALDQAVGRLGAQQLKVLIIEYAANELFRSQDKKIAEANKRVYEHSLVVALIARDVAALIANPEPDACYLAGLLHDVGKPVLAAMLLEVERQMTKALRSFIDVSQWTATIEATHRKVGVALASEWKLPDSITSAIRDCSDYDAGDRNSVANIVRLSNALAKRAGYTTGPIDADDVEAMVMVGQSMLGTDQSVLTRLITNVQSRVPKVT